MPLPSRILVCTDFSAGSRPAFDFAVALAASIEATLTVLHVLRQPDYLAPETLLESVGVSPPRTVEELAREHAEASLRELLSHESVRPRQVVPKLLLGEPRARILELAASGDYDLVVLGTHGRSGLTRLLVGSVAEAVVRASPCPVLTIPSGSAAERLEA